MEVRASPGTPHSYPVLPPPPISRLFRTPSPRLASRHVRGSRVIEQPIFIRGHRHRQECAAPEVPFAMALFAA